MINSNNLLKFTKSSHTVFSTHIKNKKIIKDIIQNDPAMNNVVLQHAYLSKKGYFLEFYGEYGKWTNNPMYSAQFIPTQKKL
jgi:hypothetical protein